MPAGAGLRSAAHLHAARAADGGVRHVPVAPDLVGRVDDHDAAPEVVRQHAGELADDGRPGGASAVGQWS